MFHPVRHAYLLERFHHALLTLRGKHAAVRQWKLDILIDGQVADQIERLENESDLSIPYTRPFAHRKILHGRAIKMVRPLCWTVEQSNDGQKSRLAAPVR